MKITVESLTRALSMALAAKTQKQQIAGLEATARSAISELYRVQKELAALKDSKIDCVSDLAVANAQLELLRAHISQLPKRFRHIERGTVARHSASVKAGV